MGERYSVEMLTCAGMKELNRLQQQIASHPYAFEVCSYFLQCYYNVVANSPELACQFYSHESTVVRMDCQTMKSSFGETIQEINDIIMSMNIHKVEVKTANFLETYKGALQMLVTGLVQLKDYPVRKRFSQTMVLAPQANGYFVYSDIFKLICDEYDYYEAADYSHTDNILQMDVHNTMTETASDGVAGEVEAKETFAPADIEERDPAFVPENHEVPQEDPLESWVVIDEDSPSEDPIDPSFPSSTNSKQDSPHGCITHPSTLTPEEEPMAEPVKQTYASVLRTKGNPSHQATLNKATTRSVESQQNGQMTKQVQPVHEKPNPDTHDEDEEFLSVYVRNLSPSTSVFDLEKVFQAFGKIRPDGVAIRSRKEAGVFFGFIEYEDISGIRNALRASPIELNGRLIHVEERRPNSGVYRVGGAQRGRGRAADFSRGQTGGRYDGDYATRSKGNGYQRKG